MVLTSSTFCKRQLQYRCLNFGLLYFSCMPKEFFDGDGKGNRRFDSRCAKICPETSGQY